MELEISDPISIIGSGNMGGKLDSRSRKLLAGWQSNGGDPAVVLMEDNEPASVSGIW